jgi:Septum formation
VSRADAEQTGPRSEEPTQPAEQSGTAAQAGERTRQHKGPAEPNKKLWLRNPSTLIAAAAGLATVVSAIVGILSLTGSPGTNTKSGAQPARSVLSTPSSPGTIKSTVGVVSVGALQAGDCVQEKGLSSTNIPWSATIQVVPCNKPHAGEVFFSGDYWPQDAAYPGDQTMTEQAKAKCASVFYSYVGTTLNYSTLNFVDRFPLASTWKSVSDRYMFCVAYDPKGPLRATVRGSRR